MQKSKEISIIIVSYQSINQIGLCVDSVFDKLKNRNFEIVIINNDPEENIRTELIKLPEIKIVDSSRNVGFAAAANVGAGLAKGKWLMFLNPDTRILTSQAKIFEILKKEENLGIISPQLIDKDGEPQRWSKGTLPSLTELLRNNLWNKSDDKERLDNSPRKVDWVSGAAMFVKKDVFDEIGGFDENFFMYFEDIDLCKRTKETGSKIVYFPEEKIEHLGGKSIADEKKQKKDYYKSQDYYFKKHHGKTIALILSLLRKLFERKYV